MDTGGSNQVPVPGDSGCVLFALFTCKWYESTLLPWTMRWTIQHCQNPISYL